MSGNSSTNLTFPNCSNVAPCTYVNVTEKTPPPTLPMSSGVCCDWQGLSLIRRWLVYSLWVRCVLWITLNIRLFLTAWIKKKALTWFFHLIFKNEKNYKLLDLYISYYLMISFFYVTNSDSGFAVYFHSTLTPFPKKTNKKKIIKCTLMTEVIAECELSKDKCIVIVLCYLMRIKCWASKIFYMAFIVYFHFPNWKNLKTF